MKKKRIQGWLAVSVLAMSLWSVAPVYAESIGSEEEITPSQPTPSNAGFDLSTDYAVWISDGDSKKGIVLYNIEDKSERVVSANGSSKDQLHIDGDNIVWVDSRNGKTDIYDYNIKTKTETRLTTNAVPSDLDIQGNKVVWTDKRDGKSNIYVYDLATKAESKISSSNKASKPSVFGNYIIWEDARNTKSGVYFYNLGTNSETRVSSSTADQKNPILYNGAVVYEEGGDIYQYTISNGNKKKLLSKASKQESVHMYEGYLLFKKANDLKLYNISKNKTTSVVSDYSKSYKPVTNGKYVLYAVKEKDNKKDVVHMYLYDIKKDKKVKMGGGFDNPKEPSASDDYVIFINDEDAVLMNIDSRVSKVISSSQEEPEHPQVSNSWAVYFDNDKDDLVAYQIKSGQKRKVNDSKEKPMKDQFHLYNNLLVWVDKAKSNYVIKVTNLSSGKTQKLESVNDEPDYVGVNKTSVMWVTKADSSRGQVYVYDMKDKNSTIVNRTNSPIKGASMGDKYVVWSELSDYDDYDVVYYDLKSERTDTISEDYDQIEPVISRDTVIYKDNGRTDSDTKYKYVVYDLENSDHIGTIDERDIEEGPGVGGNRLVYVDKEDKMYTMAFSKRVHEDDTEDPGDIDHGNYVEYNMQTLVKDDELSDIVKKNDAKNVVIVFFAGTSLEKKYSLSDMMDGQMNEVLDLFSKVELDDVKVYVYK